MKRNHPMSNCPLCGSNRIAPILYGKPLFNKELERQLKEEKVWLGGCCLTGADPMYHCFGRGENVHDWEAETLTYYKLRRASFIANTLSADMEETRNRFLAHLAPGARILDLGCGSGRDTKAFLQLGFHVDAADGSAEMCRSASKRTGIPVKQMLFQELDEIDVYDGIWACASILHLPKPELADVLKRISAALKIGGVLYASFKYGTFEGMRNGRFFTDFTEESLAAFWQEIEGLRIMEQWITQDVRPERGEERWINILARCI